jgi:hypothetical protein
MKQIEKQQWALEAAKDTYARNLVHKKNARANIRRPVPGSTLESSAEAVPAETSYSSAGRASLLPQSSP